jgi:D-alanyl-lipoteichoic acid acyltransferase DltB (MBOAT superfamily)
MLFNSFTFIGVFLPITLAGFFLLAGTGRQRLAGLWLTLASFVFYGWWDWRYLPLLLGSIAFNYAMGGVLRKNSQKKLLVAGIAANVLLLGFFKYTNFFITTVDQVTGLNLFAPHIVLPLAISFFTFQQIAYLVDAYDGAVTEHDFLNYCLFITFFPHLIAGPITHHKEMLGQFSNPDNFRPRWDNLSVGTTLFLLGLFKKVVFADPMGATAAPIFAGFAGGADLSMLDAWKGAMCYTFQLYFDFSGYTDMAIGLGLLFGISLPPNFDSPLKAHNIADFWSRWHMTLTRFLTAYLYNPIVLKITRARVAAGKPLPKRGQMSLGTFVSLVAIPTMITMSISGVWHGAGWTFIVFGLLHGVYLVTVAGWRALKASWGWKLDSDKAIHKVPAIGLTFLCVVVGMVVFRSQNLTAAVEMLAAMAGLRSVVIPPSLAGLPVLSQAVQALHLTVAQPFFFRPLDLVQIGAFLAFVWVLPNTQQWLGHFRTALNWRPRVSWVEKLWPASSWRPNAVFGIIMGLLAFFALARAFSRAPTEFLYFQF